MQKKAEATVETTMTHQTQQLQQSTKKEIQQLQQSTRQDIQKEIRQLQDSTRRDIQKEIQQLKQSTQREIHQLEESTRQVTQKEIRQLQESTKQDIHRDVKQQVGPQVRDCVTRTLPPLLQDPQGPLRMLAQQTIQEAMQTEDYMPREQMKSCVEQEVESRLEDFKQSTMLGMQGSFQDYHSRVQETISKQELWTCGQLQEMSQRASQSQADLEKEMRARLKQQEAAVKELDRKQEQLSQRVLERQQPCSDGLKVTTPSTDRKSESKIGPATTSVTAPSHSTPKTSLPLPLETAFVEQESPLAAQLRAEMKAQEAQHHQKEVHWEERLRQLEESMLSCSQAPVDQPQGLEPSAPAKEGVQQELVSTRHTSVPPMPESQAASKTGSAGWNPPQGVPAEWQQLPSGQWIYTPPAPIPRETTRGVIKLPKFAGKQPLDSFLNQVENAASMGNWDDTYTARQLYASLEGAAQQFVDGMPAQDRSNLRTLIDALRNRFDSEVEKGKARDALRYIKRRKGETIEDLCQRIKDLTKKAHAESAREEEGLVALRTAVSEELGKLIITSNFTSMDKAMTELSRLDNWNQTQVLNKGRAAAREIKEDQEQDSLKKMLQELKSEIGSVQKSMRTEMQRELGPMRRQIQNLEQKRDQPREGYPGGYPGQGYHESNFNRGRGRGNRGGYGGRGRGGVGRGTGGPSGDNRLTAKFKCTLCHSEEHPPERCPQQQDMAGPQQSQPGQLMLNNQELGAGSRTQLNQK